MSAPQTYKVAPPRRQVATFDFVLNPAGGGGDEKGCSRDFKLDFLPQTMVVRQVSWSGDANPGFVTKIKASALSDETIATISGAADGSVSPGTVFVLAKMPQKVKFEFPQALQPSATPPPPTTSEVIVSLTLEFRA